MDFAAKKFANEGLDGVTGESWETAYEISNAEQLALLAARVNDENATYGSLYYKLTNDIFLAPHPWTPIGNLATTAFAGNFDGQNHTIYGLNIDTDQGFQGLFGYVSGESIKNLNLKSGIINTTGSNVGSLIANASGGSVENVSSNVEIHGTNNIGGLVGVSSGSCQILMSTYSGYAFGNSAGGIVGNNGGTISKCTADCYLSGTEKVGALAAENSGTISNCVAKGTIDGPGSILAGLDGNSLGFESNTIACSFYGSATNDNLTLDPNMTACWAVVNNRKLISTDLDDPSWVENWVVVPELNNGLPMQKGLFWIGDDVMTSADKIKEALDGFVPVN